jgi:hypothetical protein
MSRLAAAQGGPAQGGAIGDGGCLILRQPISTVFCFATGKASP